MCILRWFVGGIAERFKIKGSEITGIILRVGWFRLISKICKRVVLIFFCLVNFVSLVGQILVILQFLKILVVYSHFEFIKVVRYSCNSEYMSINDVSIIKVIVEDTASIFDYLCSE